VREQRQWKDVRTSGWRLVSVLRRGHKGHTVLRGTAENPDLLSCGGGSLKDHRKVNKLNYRG
jgi:hypothetical protein